MEFEREERIRLLVKESTRNKLKKLAKAHDSTMMLVIEKLVDDELKRITNGN